MLHHVYIGIGSNLDNPLQHVKSAIQEMQSDEHISLNKVSNLYQSKPLCINGKHSEIKQADYINAVVQITTGYSPDVLLEKLQALEQNHNRIKEYRWGPRTLDLDILLYDDLILETEYLTIPHVELVNRDFVVYPLNDINPELDIPKYGKLKTILLNLPPDNLVLLEHYDQS